MVAIGIDVVGGPGGGFGGPGGGCGSPGRGEGLVLVAVVACHYFYYH